MGRVSRQPAGEKRAYNPGTPYKWEPEDIFELTGEEFSTLLNTLRIHATTPAGAPAVSIVDCHNILEGLLMAGVEAGIVKEVVKEEEIPAPLPAVPLPGQ